MKRLQSKGILPILSQLYPDHPLVPKCDFEPFKDGAYVEKVILGREGSNIKIINKYNAVLEQKGGEYEKQMKIYQEYIELPTDRYGKSYQTGIFFSGESSGLCIRRGTKIIHDTAEFVPHKIK